MFPLNKHPYVDEKWIEKNETALRKYITELGYEEWNCGRSLKYFLPDLPENEILLQVFPLISDKMWHKWETSYEYEHIFEKTLDTLPYHLEENNVWETQITDENIEDFNQAIDDCAHDIPWLIADTLHMMLKLKPSWAHDTIKEDWAKLNPPKKIWWDENPITDPLTRIIYERLSESNYFNDDGLYNRIKDEGHYLTTDDKHQRAYEHRKDGSEHYGDHYTYDEDGEIIGEIVEDKIVEVYYIGEQLSWEL